MIKRCAVLLLFITTIPLLGGCWDQKELTDLAFVTTMGIDKGTDKAAYNVSYQVVIPANVSSGQNGGGGGGQGPTVVVYNSMGNTLTEATREMKKQIPRRIYFAHTGIVAINEEVAREGILKLLDPLDRDVQFRTTTLVTIVKNYKAIELMSTLTNLDKIPMNKITKTLEVTESVLGESIRVTVDDILLNLSSPGKETVASVYTMKGNPKKGTSQDNIKYTRSPAVLTADGMAVFNGGKLVGWLEGERARGAVWLFNKVKETYINFGIKGKNNTVSTIPFKSKVKTAVTVKNGKPVANINIKTIFRLSEVNTKYNINDPREIENLEKKTAAQIQKEVTSSIRAAQKYKSDIFGFGERIYRSNPKQWQTLKTDWNSKFAKMDFHVNVKAYYREPGVRQNPFWNDYK